MIVGSPKFLKHYFDIVTGKEKSFDEHLRDHRKSSIVSALKFRGLSDDQVNEVAEYVMGLLDEQRDELSALIDLIDDAIEEKKVSK